MRSWSWPISVASVGWYPTALGMRPSSADTSTRLDEPEDVVDEEQHVVALLADDSAIVRPVRPTRQPRPGRLVHLPVDERRQAEHPRLGHLDPEVVPFARALAHAGEDRAALVLRGDVVDQLLDQHRLAQPGAAEEADLAAADERRDQVDDLEPGLVGLHGRLELAELRRVAVDRPALDVVADQVALVDWLADHVEDPPERRLADRNADRRPGVHDVDAARDAVGRVHRGRTRSSPRCCCTSAINSTACMPSRSGSSIRRAVLISGRLSVKTASMTTPLISMTLPTFVRAPLRVSSSHVSPAPVDRGFGAGEGRRKRARSLSKRRLEDVSPRAVEGAVERRRHPGDVVEASDVRRDRRGSGC